MADSEIDPPAAPETKATKQPKNPGPRAGELIMRAVGASRDRKGMSFYVIKKELSTQGYDVESNLYHLKRAIAKLVDKGELIRTKGVGACGTFKVNKAKKLDKKTVVKAEQPAAISKQAKKSAAAKKPEKEVVKVKVAQIKVKLE